MMRIGVIGGGAWGTALAIAAVEAGCAVSLWMRDAALAAEAAAIRENARALPGLRLPDTLRITADRGALGDAEAVMLAVPAQALRSVMTEWAGAVPPGCPAIVTAKGIERASGRFMSEVAGEAWPGAPVAVLSGPSFAADLARGLPTAVTLASVDAGLAAALAGTLSGRTLRIYHGTDVRGVEIGGAAKNVLAIGAGIVEGRGLGESAKAALVARGFAELLRFAVSRGARPETLMGLSGLGDVVLSCTSAQSRNFALGLRLGRGEPQACAPEGQLTEGAFTAEILARLARAAGQDMPICEAVAAVLAGRLPVEATVAALMSRPLKAEG